jgi:hypothetical protein
MLVVFVRRLVVVGQPNVMRNCKVIFMEILTPYKIVDNFLLVLFQAVIILWPFGPDSYVTRHWPLMPKHYWDATLGRER